MREPHEWAALNLGPGVRLLLGWRHGRHGILARPVALADNVAEEMRAACVATLGRLAGGDRRPYSGVPALDAGEFLSLPLEPADVAPSEDGLTESGALLAEEAAATSQLVELVREAFENDNELQRGELESGRWLFYVVVVELEGSDVPIGFVRQYNPQRGFRTGRLLLAFQNALSRIDDPLFNFDFSFDLVIAPDEIAVLNTTAFDRVFADLDLAAAQVPDQVQLLNSNLGYRLGSEAARFLETTAQGRARLAQRLRRVAQAAHLASVTRQTLGDALERHGLPRDRFGSGDELDLQDVEDVVVLLDMLEELYFEGDFTGERRRADRYSRRG